MKKGITNRQLQAIATKNKILDTTLELIRLNGFENLSVSDIM
jgi:AcrR family transcriptional regulator